MSFVEHFLITRINVSKGFGASDGRAVRPDWLERKLALFESAALPSVRSQTNRDFSWILLVSDETPEPYMERMLRYADERTHVEAVGDYSLDLSAKLVASHLSDGTERVLTTRLDTDDLIARTFLEQVRRVADETVGDSFINFDDGYRFDLAASRAYVMRHRSNMFLSRIASVRQGQPPPTVMDVMHNRASETHTMLHLRGDRLWMQVIHGDNISTTLGTPRPVQPEGLAHFEAPLLVDVTRVPRMAMMTATFEWAYVSSMRRGRSVLRRVRRRVAGS